MPCLAIIERHLYSGDAVPSTSISIAFDIICSPFFKIGSVDDLIMIGTSDSAVDAEIGDEVSRVIPPMLLLSSLVGCYLCG